MIIVLLSPTALTRHTPVGSLPTTTTAAHESTTSDDYTITELQLFRWLSAVAIEGPRFEHAKLQDSAPRTTGNDTINIICPLRLTGIGAVFNRHQQHHPPFAGLDGKLLDRQRPPTHSANP